MTDVATRRYVHCVIKWDAAKLIATSIFRTIHTEYDRAESYTALFICF